MAGNNLHSYSKVLDTTDPSKKRPLSKCRQLQWESPYFLNITQTLVKQLDPIETNMI